MDCPSISLILLSPPPLNHLYYHQVLPARYPERPYPIVKKGLTDRGLAYLEHVQAMTAGFTPFLGEVWVTFRWYRPRRQGDLDGIFKIVLDGMTGNVYGDDKQVKRIHADCFDDAKCPRVEVEVKPLGLC